MLTPDKKRLLVWAKLEENRPHNRTDHPKQLAFKSAITSILQRNAAISAIAEGRRVPGDWIVFSDGHCIAGESPWSGLSDASQGARPFPNRLWLRETQHVYGVSRLGVIHRVCINGQWSNLLPKYEGPPADDLLGHERAFQQALCFNRLMDDAFLLSDSLAYGMSHIKDAIKAALRQGESHEIVDRIHQGVKENEEFWDQFGGLS